VNGYRHELFPAIPQGGRALVEISMGYHSPCGRQLRIERVKRDPGLDFDAG
jgi:hypothetical protein